MMNVEKWVMIAGKLETIMEKNESYHRYEQSKNDLLSRLKKEVNELQFLRLIELIECCEAQKLIVAYECITDRRGIQVL